MHATGATLEAALLFLFLAVLGVPPQRRAPLVARAALQLAMARHVSIPERQPLLAWKLTRLCHVDALGLLTGLFGVDAQDCHLAPL